MGKDWSRLREQAEKYLDIRAETGLMVQTGSDGSVRYLETWEDLNQAFDLVQKIEALERQIAWDNDPANHLKDWRGPPVVVDRYQ